MGLAIVERSSAPWWLLIGVRALTSLVPVRLPRLGIGQRRGQQL
jgi:hypothetical protein